MRSSPRERAQARVEEKLVVAEGDDAGWQTEFVAKLLLTGGHRSKSLKENGASEGI
jgi:hypothetical protein